jgi:myo-inositol-1(or 4)-monophosphatase
MSEATLFAAVAERAARAGGVVANESFRGDLSVDTKSRKNDLVTQADREAQQQVIATISQEFPTATLVCEEESQPIGAGMEDITLVEEIPASGDAWVVDPIDGTSNFVREIRFWATSVAALSGGEPVGVATYLPAEDDIYTAGPESVSRNDTSMAVSDRTDPETFAVGLIGWWPPRHGEEYASLFESAAAQFGDLRRMGSMQSTLALVAAGGYDAAVMPGTPHPWDSIAGVHLIRRAGGTVTNLHGESWQNGDRGLVASNGQAHETVLETVQAGIEDF